MTDANLLRQMQYLWKHRHKHDDADAIEDRLTIIERILSEPGTDDGVTASGQSVTAAYIHLTRGASQTIAVSGESVSWDSLHPFIDPVGFSEDADDLPVTQVEIPFEAYYGVKFESKWSAHTDGGTVEVRRERNGNTVRVWPTDDDPDIWTNTSGQRFSDVAVVPCKPGDKLSVFIDHDDGSTQDLANATLTVWKIETSALPQLYKAVVLAAGPLAYWRLDESAGSAANDVAGHSSGPFDATITGPTLSAAGVMQDGSGNESMDFDGSNDTVLGSDWSAFDFDGAKSFTLEAWVTPDNTSGIEVIIHKQVDSSGAGWELVRNGTTFNVNRQSGSGGHEAEGGTVAADTAYYVAATYDGSTLTLYVDGVEVAADTTAISVGANTVAVEIGYDTPTSDPVLAFDGQIDEVAVYDRALSAAEIAEHYAVGRAAA